MSDIYKSIADNVLGPLLRKIVPLKTKISTGVALTIDEIKDLYKIKDFFDSSNLQPQILDTAMVQHIPPKRFGIQAQNPTVDYSVKPVPSAPSATTYTVTPSDNKNKYVTTNSYYSHTHKEVVDKPNIRNNLDNPDDIVNQKGKEWLRKLNRICLSRKNYVLVDIDDDDGDSFEIVDKDTNENGQVNDTKDTKDTKDIDQEQLELTDFYSDGQDTGIVTLKDEIEKRMTNFKGEDIVSINAQRTYFSPIADPITIRPLIYSYVN